MSVERSFEAWEEVQRHGQDLADRLSQGFTGLIQSHITPPSFPWPNYQKPTLFEVDFPTHNFAKKDFGFVTHNSGINGVSAIFDIGNKLGQAGADIGAGLNGAVQQFFRRCNYAGGFGVVEERLRDSGFTGNDVVSDSSMDGEKLGFNSKTARLFGKSQVDRGGGSCSSHWLDDWHAGLEEGMGNPSCLDEYTAMMQWIFGGEEEAAARIGETRTWIHQANPLGLWKHPWTEWFLAFMMNILLIAFLAFMKNMFQIRTINVTYDSTTNNVEGSLVASGDLWRVEASHGSSTSTSGNENSSLFLVQLGLLFVRDSRLLLPVHLSKQHLLWYGYDRKNGMHSLSPVVWSKHRRWLLMSTVCLKPLACNKWGTRITPTVQWPDKSFTLGLAQALAWKASGLIVGPTIQFSVCPTFGGSNPGLQAELIHSVNKELSLIYGCTFMSHPSAFASLSLARSKQNGKIGSSGIAVRVETPLGTIGRPSFSVKLNSGIEF
ncbi:hypothetical protein Acr_13g0005810 [Actinidia rufa]|uniref:Uncharacterized protein n=1 Tax=Actinidia rufa TaxID=165716 RepID=A0A7J0FKG8_9ERIC|nr:hypothetical protein Acr_13g0005810 [Actinidia rufa]